MTQQFPLLLLLDSGLCVTIEAMILLTITPINIPQVIKLKLILNFLGKCPLKPSHFPPLHCNNLQLFVSSSSQESPLWQMLQNQAKMYSLPTFSNDCRLNTVIKWSSTIWPQEWYKSWQSKYYKVVHSRTSHYWYNELIVLKQTF